LKFEIGNSKINSGLQAESDTAMVDWQITATTMYCDDVDDEVTVIVQKDGSVRCVGFARYDNPGRGTAELMKQKSKQLQRQLRCTGPECRRVIGYRDRLFTEEVSQENQADSA
jgi:hypothetical protein